jgi:hypothetical protein
MDWLAFMKFTNIWSYVEQIHVRRTYFLENNFLRDDQEQEKTEKVYLHGISIYIEGEERSFCGFNCTITNFYLLKSTKKWYIPLKETIGKHIDVFLNSHKEDKFFLKIEYIFSDQPFANKSFSDENEENQINLTYKQIYKTAEKGILGLRYDGIESHLFHIKERFKGLVFMKLLKLNKYISIINLKRFEQKNETSKHDLDFDLYYFKNYSACLKNLKKFVQDLKYLNLVEHYFPKVLVEKFSFDKKTTIKTSDFMDRISKNFISDLKKVEKNTSIGSQALKNSKLIFDKYCDYLKNELLEKRILLLIGGIYDIDYYIKVLYDHIFKTSLELSQEDQGFINPNNIFSILSEMTNLFDCYLIKLQKRTIKDLCESEYIHKHFSKLLGRKVKTLDDFMIVEKMVCDYYNVFVHTANLARKFYGSFALFSYCKPLFNDDIFKYRILDGFGCRLGKGNNLNQIKAFDCNLNEVTLTKGVDFFVDEFRRLFFISDVLRKKNVKEIEIVSFAFKFKKIFKISEYLFV